MACNHANITRAVKNIANKNYGNPYQNYGIKTVSGNLSANKTSHSAIMQFYVVYNEK